MEEGQIRPKGGKMAFIKHQRAAFTVKEAIFRVFIQEKMTKICEVDIRMHTGRISPVASRVIIEHVRRIGLTNPVSLSATRT